MLCLMSEREIFLLVDCASLTALMTSATVFGERISATIVLFRWLASSRRVPEGGASVSLCVAFSLGNRSVSSHCLDGSSHIYAFMNRPPIAREKVVLVRSFKKDRLLRRTFSFFCFPAFRTLRVNQNTLPFSRMRKTMTVGTMMEAGIDAIDPITNRR